MASNISSMCFALILFVAVTDRIAAQSPRRLRVKGASQTQPNGRKERQSLLGVEDIHSSQAEEQRRNPNLERKLPDEEDLDLEDEILWRTFLMGRQGGGSFAPAPTANANTPPPSTPAPTDAPTMATPAPTDAPTMATPMPTIRFVPMPPTDAPTTPATPAPTDAPVTPNPTDALVTPNPTGAPVTPAPTDPMGVPLHCGCFDCTEAAWDTVAGGFTCGERIVFVIGMGSTEDAACRLVAGVEFPDDCGACNPDTCDDDNRDGGAITPSPATPSIPPTVSPVIGASTSFPTAETFCGCDECTADVWNTVSGLFTCGQLIESVQDVSRQQACNIIAGPDSEFADECSACACNDDPVSTTTSPTDASSGEATETPDGTEAPTAAPTPNPTEAPTAAPSPGVVQVLTRCGCSSCGAATLNAMAGEFSCSDRIDFLMSTGEQELDACRIVAGLEFADACGNCDPNTCQDIAVTDTPAEPATPAPSVTPAAPKCGCNDCEAAYNLFAGDSTCGERIEFLMDGGATEDEACRRVANVEYPFLCGPSCDPTRCDGKNPPLKPRTPIYCFPKYSDRQRYENVWGDYILEVKEDEVLGVCSPSFNKFTNNTVSVQDDELTLQYKKNGDMWEAGEVRVVMPQEKMPFQYGTYSWNVKSIQVKNVNTGAVRQDFLPPSLVLGMFTWDATEDFTVRQNYNHEVDVELGRMADPNTDNDGQFLVQPAREPNLHQFSTKDENGDFQQAPQEYSFTWNPAEIAWDTTAGNEVDHFYSSEQAVTLGLEDYVQCLPTNLEVRINLWNLNGTMVTPMEMSDDEMVEVVIDNFSYTPTNRTGVEDGGFCTKDCQCLEGSECSLGNNQCVPGNSGKRKP